MCPSAARFDSAAAARRCGSKDTARRSPRAGASRVTIVTTSRHPPSCHPSCRPAAPGTVHMMAPGLDTRHKHTLSARDALRGPRGPPVSLSARGRASTAQLTRRQRELIEEGALGGESAKLHPLAARPPRQARVGRRTKLPPGVGSSLLSRPITSPRQEKLLESVDLGRAASKLDSADMPTSQHSLPSLSLSQKLNQMAMQKKVFGVESIACESDFAMPLDIEDIVMKPAVNAVERKRLARLLMREPNLRSSHDVRELMAFSHCCDVMHGLSAAQRKVLMTTVEGKRAEQSTPVIQAGVSMSPVYVVLQGECEYYVTAKLSKPLVNVSAVRTRGFGRLVAQAGPAQRHKLPVDRGRSGRRFAIVDCSMQAGASK
jgi:hypothetical protein